MQTSAHCSICLRGSCNLVLPPVRHDNPYDLFKVVFLKHRNEIFEINKTWYFFSHDLYRTIHHQVLFTTEQKYESIWTHGKKKWGIHIRMEEAINFTIVSGGRNTFLRKKSKKINWKTMKALQLKYQSNEVAVYCWAIRCWGSLLGQITKLKVTM